MGSKGHLGLVNEFVKRVFKQNIHGIMLNTLLNCSVDELAVVNRAMCNICFREDPQWGNSLDQLRKVSKSACLDEVESNAEALPSQDENIHACRESEHVDLELRKHGEDGSTNITSVS